MPTRIGRTVTALAAAVLLATVAGCGITRDSGAQGNQSEPPGVPTASGTPPTGTPSPSSTPTPDPVVLSPNVEDGARKVAVDTLVKVKATVRDGAQGQDDLRLHRPPGPGQEGPVAGVLNKAKTTWTAKDLLEPAATYTLSMTGRNTTNQVATTKTRFTTQNLSLAEQTYPTLYPLRGMKVGIGMPVVLTFDVPVKNKRAFEKNLKVTSSPAQPGTWRWYSDTQVRYRPKNYWKPGTKIRVNADLNGVNAGAASTARTRPRLPSRSVARSRSGSTCAPTSPRSTKAAGGSAPSTSAAASPAGRPAAASS